MISGVISLCEGESRDQKKMKGKMANPERSCCPFVEKLL
jgi:hypothetical protein